MVSVMAKGTSKESVEGRKVQGDYAGRWAQSLSTKRKIRDEVRVNPASLILPPGSSDGSLTTILWLRVAPFLKRRTRTPRSPSSLPLFREPPRRRASSALERSAMVWKGRTDLVNFFYTLDRILHPVAAAKRRVELAGGEAGDEDDGGRAGEREGTRRAQSAVGNFVE
jgi:hypothetical protein